MLSCITNTINKRRQYQMISAKKELLLKKMNIPSPKCQILQLLLNFIKHYFVQKQCQVLSVIKDQKEINLLEYCHNMITFIFCALSNLRHSVPVTNKKPCLRFENSKNFIFQFACQENSKRTIEKDQMNPVFYIRLKNITHFHKLKFPRNV